MKEEVAIVFTVNNDYIAYASNAIYSIIHNCNKANSYQIFILYTDLCDNKICLLKTLETANVAIRFINISYLVNEYADLFYVKAHYSFEVYYRLFIPQLLGNEFKYIIYLDCDLIVDCDITKILYSINKEKTINGVMNFSTDKVIERIAQLGLSYKTYINAGVLVFNCEKFIVNNYLNHIFDYLAKNRELVCLDQDLLNIICKNDINTIDCAWNVQWHNLDKIDTMQPFIHKGIKKISKIKIYHYTSDVKPWNCPSKKYSKIFFKYASLNPIYNKLLISNSD